MTLIRSLGTSVVAVPAALGTATGRLVAVGQVDGSGNPTAFGVIEQPRPANTLICIGDSITGNGWTFFDASGQGLGQLRATSVRGYWGWAQMRLGHRLRILNQAGVGGDTVEMMLARVQTDVIAYRPAYVVVEAGVNNIIPSEPAVSIWPKLQSLYHIILASGARVVATTITPRDGDSLNDSRKPARHALNRMIRSYARATRGMMLADFAAATSDPTSGQWKAGLSFDGLHPAAAGAAVLGKALADTLAQVVPTFDQFPASDADTTNLLTPGALAQGTGGSKGAGVTGSVATGWTADATGTATAVASKVTRTDGKPGEWQQLAISANSGGYVRYRLNLPPLTGGTYAVGETDSSPSSRPTPGSIRSTTSRRYYSPATGLSLVSRRLRT